MSIFTAENLKLIGGAEWRHPSTGEVRIYVNNLAELYGLRTSRYNTGNISSTSLDGERIFNSAAGRILSRLHDAKIWLAGDGQLMKKGLSDSDFESIKAALAAKIESAIADRENNPAPEPAHAPEPAQGSADVAADRLTIDVIRQFESDAAGFTDVVELARHMSPVFEAHYAGVQLTTGGGLVRSDAACAIDARIERVCQEAGYPNVVGAYSLAVQMLARRGLPVFGQLEEPGFVREAVAGAGVDAYTQNEYKTRRNWAGNPEKYGAQMSADAAAYVRGMHVRFPILVAFDAYLVANGK